jgi:hypothetical protein
MISIKLGKREARAVRMATAEDVTFSGYQTLVLDSTREGAAIIKMLNSGLPQNAGVARPWIKAIYKIMQACA